MFGGFYRGRRVLVTGHTGFKGGWLSFWLKQLGAIVYGYGWPPPTQPNFYEVVRSLTFAGESTGDIRDLPELKVALAKARPELVFHLAAQSLVRRSYADPLETLTTNVVGTANVLDAVRQTELGCVVVIVTSDKCYENQNWEFGYRETDPLGGQDVYSMSKGAAELVIQSWRRAFFQTNSRLGNVASVRAGNVIGGGDYAPDRIVPDCVRALLDGKSIPVRQPMATRPWQHVLDCLSGYLWLGACLAQAEKNSLLAGPFNFGPGSQAHLPVSKLVEEFLRFWPGQWHHHPQEKALHEAQQLNLAIDKAAHWLRWRPTWDVLEAVHQTVNWYRERHVQHHPDLPAFSANQIAQFGLAAKTNKVEWANP